MHRLILRGMLIVTVALALIGCASVSETRSYEVLGVVADVPDDRRTLVLAHDAILGFMDSMIMPFAVADPGMVEGLQAGDEVRFQLVVRDAGAVIEWIEKIADHVAVFPEFELTAFGGESYSSEQFRGKVALVNFWASWCAPCRTEIPRLIEMRSPYGSADFEIVGIAQDPENLDAITRMVEEFGINYPVLLSDGAVEAAVGGIYGIPATFVIDRDGGIVYRRIGLASEEELRGAVENLF